MDNLLRALLECGRRAYALFYHLREGDPLTAWWIIVIVLVGFTAFVVLLVPLILRALRTKYLTFRCRRDLDGAGSDKTAARSHIMKRLQGAGWLRKPALEFDRDWRASFLSDEEAAIGDSPFVEYVSPSDAVPWIASRHVAGVVPGVLVALGILGTFVGLVKGMPDLGSADLAPDDVGKLVSGVTKSLSLAFWTSIAGIATSTLFLLIDRFSLHFFESSIGRLGRAVDAAYPRITRDEALQRQLQLVDQGVATLGHLGADLASSLANTIGQAFTGAIQSELGPMIDALQKGVDNLASMSGEAHVNAMREMVDGVLGSMSNAMGDQVSKLEQTLNTTVEAQRSLQNKLEEFYDRFEKTSEAQTQVLERTARVGEALGETISRLEHVSGTLASAADRAAAAAERLEVSAEATRSAQESVSENQHELLETAREQVEELSQARAALHEAWTSAVDRATGAIRQIQEASRELGDKVGDQLVVALEKFDLAVSETVERFDGTLVRVDSSIQELPPAAADVRQGVKELNGAVSGLGQTIGNIEKIVSGLLTKNVQEAVDAAGKLEASTENAGAIVAGATEAQNALSNAVAELRLAVSQLQEIDSRFAGTGEEITGLKTSLEPLEAHLGSMSAVFDKSYADNLLGALRELRLSVNGNSTESEAASSSRGFLSRLRGR